MAETYPLTVAQAKAICRKKYGAVPTCGHESQVTNPYPQRTFHGHYLRAVWLVHEAAGFRLRWGLPARYLDDPNATIETNGLLNITDWKET